MCGCVAVAVAMCVDQVGCCRPSIKTTVLSSTCTKYLSLAILALARHRSSNAMYTMYSRCTTKPPYVDQHHTTPHHNTTTCVDTLHACSLDWRRLCSQSHQLEQLHCALAVVGYRWSRALRKHDTSVLQRGGWRIDCV
jgi:hypothetical protein